MPLVHLLRHHQRLRCIGSTISRLGECCQNMHLQVAAARRDNAPILEETTSLLAQKDDVEAKKQLLEAFNRHFIISEDELRLITANTDIVDDTFFQVLARVKRIHQDCQVLLGTENERLGLELMEDSSRNLNSAYQKLYRWIQREFKTLNLENPQISSVIRRALKALAERPLLFQNCLDFFSEAREHVLLDAFYSALTGPISGEDRDQATRPIEYHSHEPLRYVGDMLAWTHSASVSEREALENLSNADSDDIVEGIRQGIEREPWASVDDGLFDVRRALEDLASQNLSGVIQVLRQRVEQVIQNQGDPVTTYKIANLLGFYQKTFMKLLGINNPIVNSLESLEQFAFLHFEKMMTDNVKSNHIDATQVSLDLQIPDFLSEALENLRSIIRNFDASLTPASERQGVFEKVLNIALEPFLVMCRETGHRGEEPSQSIFLANCYEAVQAILSGYDFVLHRLQKLNDEISSCTARLVEFQHAFFLHNSGLYSMVKALASLSEFPSAENPPISALPSFRPAALQHTSQALDDFLPSALIDATENLKGLSNKQMASDITMEAAERFCEDFEFVESHLVAFDDAKRQEFRDQSDNDRNTPPGESLKDLFPRTTNEIRVLLS